MSITNELVKELQNKPYDIVAQFVESGLVDDLAAEVQTGVSTLDEAKLAIHKLYKYWREDKLI